MERNRHVCSKLSQSPDAVADHPDEFLRFRYFNPSRKDVQMSEKKQYKLHDMSLVFNTIKGYSMTRYFRNSKPMHNELNKVISCCAYYNKCKVSKKVDSVEVGPHQRKYLKAWPLLSVALRLNVSGDIPVDIHSKKRKNWDFEKIKIQACTLESNKNQRRTNRNREHHASGALSPSHNRRYIACNRKVLTWRKRLKSVSRIRIQTTC